MFDAKLENGQDLKKIVSALKELIDQAAWDITEEGIQLQSMDSSHVALVQMNIHQDSFEHFRCDGTMQMGLNMQNLNKIFSAFSNGSVSIMADDQDSDTVKWIFESEKKEGSGKMKVKAEAQSDEDDDESEPEDLDESQEPMDDEDDKKNLGKKKKDKKKAKEAAKPRGPLNKKQTFELRLMDLDVEQLGIPEQDYQAKFTMPSSEFTKIIKDLLIIGETVIIDVKKSSVTFKAEGEIGKSEIHLQKDEAIGSTGESFDLQVEDPIELSFATQYLKKFSTAGPLARDVTVALSADVPMVIAYEVEGFGHLKYFLAPKIDDEDED